MIYFCPIFFYIQKFLFLFSGLVIFWNFFCDCLQFSFCSLIHLTQNFGPIFFGTDSNSFLYFNFWHPLHSEYFVFYIASVCKSVCNFVELLSMSGLDMVFKGITTAELFLTSLAREMFCFLVLMESELICKSLVTIVTKWLKITHISVFPTHW